MLGRPRYLSYIGDATGDWSLRNLADELESRGLTFRPSAKQTTRRVPPNKLHQILRNRYYIGFVSYGGVEYEGKHPKLVDFETFQAVQTVLEEHRTSGERSYRRDNYLAGSLRCARCKSRLLYAVSRGRQGSEYGYFFCAGRHGKKTNCTLRYLPEQAVDAAVAAYWLSEPPLEDRELVREQLLLDFADQTQSLDAEREQLEQRIHTVKRERLKWAEKAMEGVVPDDIARSKQQQLGQQLLQAESKLQRLARVTGDHLKAVEAVLDMIQFGGHAYQSATPLARRAYNQSWFHYIEVDEDEDGISIVNAAQPEIIEAIRTAKPRLAAHGRVTNKPGSRNDYRVRGRVRGSNVDCLVELVGRYSKLPDPCRIEQLLTDLRTSKPQKPSSVPSRRHRLADRLGPEVIAAIIAQYEAGAPSTQLGRDYGISKESVLRLLKDSGVKLRRQGLSPTQAKDVVRLYESGLSLVQVGQALRVDPSTAHLELKRVGVRMRPPHERGRRGGLG